MGAIIKMPELLDLAFKSEKTMNPYLLQTALHSLVSHLNMRDMKIEFRGADAKQIQASVANAKTDSVRNIKVVSSVSIKSQKPGEKDVSITSESNTSGDADLKKLIELDEVVVVENGVVKEPTRPRSVSFRSFNRLENKVKSLQAQLEALNVQVLPPDDTILEATRSKQGAKPISDLMQSLNITKRMTGAEEGLDRLASLLETVAKEYSDLRTVIDKMQGELGENVADTMEQIKLAANYARQIRPREKFLRKYKSEKRDRSKGTSKSKTTSSGAELTDGYLEGSAKYTPEDAGKFAPPSGDSFIAFGAGLDHPAESTQRVYVPAEGEIETKLESARKLNLGDEASPQKFDIDKVASAEPVVGSAQGIAGVGGSGVVHSLETFSGAMTSPSAELAKEGSRTGFFNVISKIDADETVHADKVNRLLVQHESVKKNMEYMTAQINTLADFADLVLPEILAGLPHSTELRKRIAELQKDTKPPCPDGPEDTDEVIITSRDLNERMEGVEARLIKHQAKLKRQDFFLADKSMELEGRIGKLTKSLAEVVDVLGLRKHKQKPKEEEELDRILGKVGNLEEALIEIGCATQNLLNDKEYKMTILEGVTEEIKLIKLVKLDRFEIEDLLANKADCDELNKKVGLDKFDDVTNELARGTDEVMNKISTLEMQLATMVGEVQNYLDEKYDKISAEELREEINAQLEHLAAQLSKLSPSKDGRLAAGGKQKFLTDINCLSCDRNAAMASETGVPCIPVLADLTHMRSIRPFITYELEYLRKMKIKDPEVIKYIEYEELLRRYKISNTDSYDKLANVPHLAKRYCGGAHTKTGPQQKVPHSGHFELNQRASKNF